MFPIASYELDILDQTFGELIGTLYYNFDLTCLAGLMIEDPKFKLMFQHATSLPRALSLLAIYNTKAFLPSLGQVTHKHGGGYDPAQGEWQEYDTRSRNGFIQSPFDRWDQKGFAGFKRYLRSMFLGSYNSDDSTYEDENERNFSLQLGLKKSINLTNYSIPLNAFKRRKLIQRPFSKDGDDCS